MFRVVAEYCRHPPIPESGYTHTNSSIIMVDDHTFNLTLFLNFILNVLHDLYIEKIELHLCSFAGIAAKIGLGLLTTDNTIHTHTHSAPSRALDLFPRAPYEH